MSGSRIAPAPQQGGQLAGEDTAFLKRAEVRDVLAWVRLLVDPQDAAAVVRALARPPIELRQVDLARVIQVARRRKLDLVLGLAAATEAPQVPPEARERIERFMALHSSASAELDTAAPDVFVDRLIERVGMRGRPLLAPEHAAEQGASLQRLHALAVDFAQASPGASTRQLALHLAAVAPDLGREPAVDSASGNAPGERAGALEAPGGPGEAPDEGLLEALERLREEVLAGVARIGGRLGELRLDTELDISHGIVRYLELLKVSALVQRADGQSTEEALEDINMRLLAAATPLQREILQTSTLDQSLVGPHGDRRARAQALAPREEHSLGPFLPRKGIGLALSASDIQTYRSCPLRYKFARVLRIPTEQTIHQRFGIVVHQVLERFHTEGGETLEQMLALLDAGWRRSGFGEDREEDRELLEKARTALQRYHARLQGQESQPVWFERAFSFRLGPHHLRGRVDRVDRLADGAGELYELIDYKTSRPKTAEQLRDDIQLSLYALAAREDWRLESSRQAYYYVLDDLRVPVPSSEGGEESVRQIVLEAGEGILAQAFEPTPSQSACGICDYRIVCPVAER